MSCTNSVPPEIQGLKNVLKKGPREEHMCLLLAAFTLKDDMVRYAEHTIIGLDILINVSFTYSTFP